MFFGIMYYELILLTYQNIIIIIIIIIILDQGSLGNSDSKVSNCNLLSIKKKTIRVKGFSCQRYY